MLIKSLVKHRMHAFKKTKKPLKRLKSLQKAFFRRRRLDQVFAF